MGKVALSSSEKSNTVISDLVFMAKMMLFVFFSVCKVDHLE